MGVIKRGILGGFSGSVGNVVGSSWKGIATMKSKPLSVANPNTAAQVAQRTKMTNIVAAAKEILQSIIKPLNDRFASGQSGYNLFVQRNIDLFATVMANPPGDLIIAAGPVALTPDMAVVADASGDTVTCTWTDNTGDGNALGTDELYVYYENDDQQYRVGVATGIARSVEVAVIPDTVMATGNTLNLYFAWRRADGSQVSDTQYVLQVVQA